MEPKAEGKGDAVPHIGPRTYKQRDGTVKDEWGDPGKILPSLPLPESPPTRTKYATHPTELMVALSRSPHVGKSSSQSILQGNPNS